MHKSVPLWVVCVGVRACVRARVGERNKPFENKFSTFDLDFIFGDCPDPPARRARTTPNTGELKKDNTVQPQSNLRFD